MQRDLVNGDKRLLEYPKKNNVFSEKLLVLKCVKKNPTNCKNSGRMPVRRLKCEEEHNCSGVEYDLSLKIM